MAALPRGPAALGSVLAIRSAQNRLDGFFAEANGYTIQGSAAEGNGRDGFATGGLSVPHYPEIDGLDDFRGQAHHTGAWPHTPVDFAGKRVAIIGNGPSGAQLLPAIADTVAAVDVYQRSPTWTTPLNNAPISDERQAWLTANFDGIGATSLACCSTKVPSKGASCAGRAR